LSRPDHFTLEQNYPNPFNPSTTIKYSIPVSGNIKLSVYNILGKEVLTLVNGYKEVGTYLVQLNASSLPSGIYVYSIQSGQYRESKKMTILK
ncbi:MAG: T9SS type A sorting domain-containing protein, partial [Bacteroidota bacterium]|nr:T9SS type A sorting domain-containing protein [Bacteroidota bacterium]